MDPLGGQVGNIFAWHAVKYGFNPHSGGYLVTHICKRTTPSKANPAVVEWVAHLPGARFTRVQSLVGGYISDSDIMAVPCHWIPSARKRTLETLIKGHLQARSN